MRRIAMQKTTPVSEALHQLYRAGAVIYGIECLVTHRIYIGVTTSPGGRLGSHLSELALGRHSNRAFMDEWQRYGERSFVFRILERVFKPGDVKQSNRSGPRARVERRRYLHGVLVQLCTCERAWINAYGPLAYNSGSCSYRIAPVSVTVDATMLIPKRKVAATMLQVSNPSAVKQQSMPNYATFATEARQRAKRKLAKTITDTVLRVVGEWSE